MLISLADACIAILYNVLGERERERERENQIISSLKDVYLIVLHTYSQYTFKNEAHICPFVFYDRNISLFQSSFVRLCHLTPSVQ